MKQQNNTKKFIEITSKQLPLCCPMPNMTTWNSHPRVFLQIEKEASQEITCPYCSTHYKLISKT